MLLDFTYTGKIFSDANNTVFNSTGATGIVPAYHLWDLNVNWKFLRAYSLSGGINNLMYPGPGILPGDGRTFYMGVGVKL